MREGVPIAVVFGWRDFLALQQRRTRLTTIMDAVEYTPSVGKVPGLVRGTDLVRN